MRHGDQVLVGESPYPHAVPEHTGIAESPFDREYIDRLVKQVKSSIDDIAQYYVDQTNRVDEYRVQSLGGESLTTESLQPDYECDEIITGAIVTGPSSATQTVVPQAAPAAGVNFSYTNTTGAPQSIVAFTATFTADAVVANRFPSAQILDANNDIMYSAVDGTAVVASGVLNLRGFQGATQQNSGAGNATLPLPIGMLIPPGGKFLLNGIVDAGDQWSNIVLTFCYSGVGTGFNLQLGKRSWQLLLPETGILLISPIQVKLGRSDQRNLIASVAGDWSLELMGYAETGRRGRV